MATAKKPGLGLLFTILAGVTNVAGDAILVGVVSQGDPIKAVQGAAFATAAGLFVGGVVPLIYFARKNSSLLRLGKPEKSGKALAKACGNGSSEFFANISGSIINVVYNSLFLYMIGDMGVAAYGTVGYVNSIFTAFNNGRVSGIISIVRTLVFNLLTIVAVPIIFFYAFGSSYEAAFCGVWYSIVFSELLATLMTFGFLAKYKKRYQYA